MYYYFTWWAVFTIRMLRQGLTRGNSVSSYAVKEKGGTYKNCSILINTTIPLKPVACLMNY